MAVCFAQLWSMSIVEHRHFTRQCSDAFQGWWDISLSLYCTFTAKSVGKRIVKIGQNLAKLDTKNKVAPFSPNKL